MNDAGHTPEDYELPLYPVLTRRPLFGGVPRALGIVNLTSTLALGLTFDAILFTVPVGFLIHWVCVYLTARDEWWLEILRRHLAQPSYFSC